MTSHTFYPNLTFFYTDISAISVTFCNSAITSINLGQPSSQALIGYPRSVRLSHCGLFYQSCCSLTKKPRIMCTTFFLLWVSCPFWPGTPALLHMHDIPPTPPARLPDFPLLANSQTWSAHAGKTFQLQCNPCSPSLSLLFYTNEWKPLLSWFGPSPQAHPPLPTMQSSVAAPIYKACRLNMPPHQLPWIPTPHYCSLAW